MVYIGPDGTVSQNQPWSFQRLINLFWGVVAGIVLFFRTLVGFDGDTSNTGRNGSKYGGGGGNGPGGGRGGGPRRIGRITTIQDCSIPGGG